MGDGLKRAFAAARATRKKGDMAKKTTTEKPTKKLTDKGRAATKAAMTPPPMRAANHEAKVIPMNAGGPALASVPAPVAEAVAITEITAQWSVAKRMEAQGKSEADKKKAEIIKHFGDPKKVIGYSDNHLNVTKSDDVDYADPRLATFLKEHGWWDALKKPEVLDPALVKSKALTEPELQKLLDSLTEEKPKFNQVKDAKEDKE